MFACLSVCLFEELAVQLVYQFRAGECQQGSGGVVQIFRLRGEGGLVGILYGQIVGTPSISLVRRCHVTEIRVFHWIGELVFERLKAL